MQMKQALPLLLLVVPLLAAKPAQNVILFIGDAGGISTLHAASIHAHNQPQALFIQNLPHIALMDTSTASDWVSDSAAGMTAIVTGRKTKNGVISQSAEAVRGQSDGETLQTILEHAEARGLSTGVITNMAITDATPAACYAHANERKSAGEIFAQVLKPRFGDGVDVVIGAGRSKVIETTQKLGLDIEQALRDRGYTLAATPAEVTAEARRCVALYDGADFDPLPVVERVVRGLARNPKGYFLMVEWDMHTSNLPRGLDRVVVMDRLVRQTAAQAGEQTLILFAADHSFDLRVRGGKRGESMLPEAGASPTTTAKPKIRVEDGHTGEQVLAAAQGPGAERVRGFIANTDLFKIMMVAYGWSSDRVDSAGTGKSD